jgi:hypothetical protein
MSSATTPKTVDLGGGAYVQRELVAGGSITPGMLVERNSSGVLVAHAGAGLAAQAAFAVENEAVGRGIDDAYASGDQVPYRIFAEGHQVYAILAAGQNVSKDALLQSAGNGRLSAAATADNVVAIALEAVDATSAAKRIRVEICKAYTAA